MYSPAAQPAPVPVEQEVAQVRAQRLAVAEVVVPLDECVPELGVLLLLDQLQAQRLGIGALGRQRQDAGLLELFQQAQGGRAPVELLADRLRQFLAAHGRERGHRLLDIGDRPAREAPAEEGDGLEILDAGIHGSSQEACSWLPLQIRSRMLRVFLGKTVSFGIGGQNAVTQCHCGMRVLATCQKTRITFCLTQCHCLEPPGLPVRGAPLA